MQWLDAYEKRIDNTTLRERVLIFSAALLLLVVGFYFLFISPLLAKEKLLNQRSAQQSAELIALQHETQRAMRAQSGNGIVEVSRRIEALRAQLGALDRRAAEEQQRFTPPDQMRTVLQEMLARNKRLALVELRTLPLATLSAGNPGAGQRRIFKHGVELTVKGRYADLYAYLQSLEHLPTQLYWGRADLSAADYPLDVLKLTVFTVSFDKAWLVV